MVSVGVDPVGCRARTALGLKGRDQGSYWHWSNDPCQRGLPQHDPRSAFIPHPKSVIVPHNRSVIISSLGTAFVSPLHSEEQTAGHQRKAQMGT